MSIGVLQIATCVGEHEVSVDELAAEYDASAAAVRRSVEGLRVLRSDRSSLELGVTAARDCLAEHGHEETIDCVIWCGAGGERIQASDVQRELGLARAFALTPLCDCTGVPMALRIARGLVRDGSARKVLIVHGERWPERLRFLAVPGSDRFSTTTRAHVFSDSGGAMIVGESEALRLEAFGFANLIQSPVPALDADADLIATLAFAYEELPMQRLAIERCLNAAQGWSPTISIMSSCPRCMRRCVARGCAATASLQIACSRPKRVPRISAQATSAMGWTR